MKGALLLATFFISGGSSGASSPVADFTGTPTSGTFPLSVTFTDTSTGSPDSWSWEKNNGSGWVAFAGTPTAQNPTEVFADGLWSVRMTAGNGGGSNTKTIFDYVGNTAPLASSATLLYSGGIVELIFSAPFTLGAGTAVVRIDGTNYSCPRVYQIATDTLWVRVPTANVATSGASLVRASTPPGMISLGTMTYQACTNDTNTETLLPTVPPGNASDIVVGNNYGSPVYYSQQTVFSNAAALLSAWDAAGGTGVTYGANGLPLTLVGGPGFLRAFMFVDVTAPFQIGDYLLRTKGAGTAVLCYNFSTPGTVSHTGTAGGWNYQVVNIPVYGQGLVVQGYVPLTDLDLILPGDWDPVTFLPKTVVDADWSAAYSKHGYMRALGWFVVNNSNVRYAADYFPDGYYTQGQKEIRGATGNIVSATSTTSTFIGGGTVWLITHDIAGDPFQTGDIVTTAGELRQVERIGATQYKTFNTSNPPSGAITFSVQTCGIIEEIARAHNELNQGLWWNLPAMLDDAGVTAAVNRMLAVLTPGIKVRLEYSNECWNFFFYQTQYLSGLARVAGSAGHWVEYANRAADVHKLALDRFTAAGRAADLIRVVAWQADDSATGKAMMDAYKARCVAQGYSFTAPHEYACTNYFVGPNLGSGSDPASTQLRDFVMNGSLTPDPLPAAGLVDFAAYNLLHHTLDVATASAAMVTTWNSTNTAAVEAVTYEGSQALDGAELSYSGRASGDGPNYAGTNGLDGAGLQMDLAFQRANRHPRMANAVRGSMKQCLDLGYTAWSNFSTFGNWGRYGYWGDREYFDQPIGAGAGNLADLNRIVGADAVKLFAEQQWIDAAGPTTGITITAIPTDKIFQFDVGQTYSTVPLAGTYSGGAPSGVEAQAIDADFFNRVIVNWTSVGGSVGAGAWSGTLQIPRHPRRYYVKVRAANNHAVTATLSTTFYVGGMLIGYGQSNWLGMMDGNDNPPAANASTRQFDGVNWVAVPAANGIRELLNELVNDMGCAWGVYSGGQGGVPIVDLQSGTAPFIALAAVIAAGGGKACAIVFRQGEGDANGVGTTEAGYAADMDTLHGSLVGLLGRTRAQCPMFISSLATVNDPAYPYWETVQASQVNAPLTYANIIYTHSNVTSPMFDAIHQTALGYGQSGKESARGILQNFGTVATKAAWFISAVARVTTTMLDVTVVHSMGTDFTPTSGITGFDVSADNGATWSAATGVRQSSTVVRLTHSSIAAAVTVLVRYQAVKLPDVSGAVLDNGTFNSALNHSAWQTLSAAGSGSLPVPTYRSTVLPTGPDSTHQLCSGFSIGTADAARLVIGTLTVASDSGAPITTIVLEPDSGSPVTATIVLNTSFASSGNIVIFQGIVPTGTTLGVRSTWPSGYANSGIVSIWTVPSGDMTSTTALDSDSASGTATSESVNISSGAGGFIIAAAAQNDTTTQAASIDGTETYAGRYNSVQSAARHLAADATNTSAQTNTNTVTANYVDSAPIAVAAASWR